MTDLNKKESFYFILFAFLALTVIISSLFIWSQTQETCWSKYPTEQQAIQECEK